MQIINGSDLVRVALVHGSMWSCDILDFSPSQVTVKVETVDMHSFVCLSKH